MKQNLVKAALVVGLAILGVGFAAAGTRLVADHPGQIQIGDNVFAGGKLELNAPDNSPVVQLRINGKHVATFFKDTLGALPNDGRVDLVFIGEPGKPARLVGIQKYQITTGDSDYVDLKVAAVNPKLAVVMAAQNR